MPTIKGVYIPPYSVLVAAKISGLDPGRIMDIAVGKPHKPPTSEEQKALRGCGPIKLRPGDYCQTLGPGQRSRGIIVYDP